MSRASAGLPLLVAVPGYGIVVSVFDERTARGANGSSALPVTTAKSVPGIAATIQRDIAYEMENGVDKVETEWQISTAAGDKIEFSASYPETAAYFHSVSPASRIDYANCNLKHVSDIVYRSTPNKTYPLFARDAFASQSCSRHCCRHAGVPSAIFSDRYALHRKCRADRCAIGRRRGQVTNFLHGRAEFQPGPESHYSGAQPCAFDIDTNRGAVWIGRD